MMDIVIVGAIIQMWGKQSCLRAGFQPASGTSTAQKAGTNAGLQARLLAPPAEDLAQRRQERKANKSLGGLGVFARDRFYLTVAALRPQGAVRPFRGIGFWRRGERRGDRG